MATVNFLYRSVKDKAPLELRLLFSLNNTAFVFGAKTKFEVEKHYWSKQHKLQRVKDIDVLNRQTEVNNELTKISNYILTSFNSIPELEVLDVVNKQWLQTQIDNFYSPPKTKEEQEKAKIPTDLIGYIDFYVADRKNEVTKSTLAKVGVNKNLLIKFKKDKKHSLSIKDVNNQFKIDFETYCLGKGYAPNTIARSLRFIKTLCRHAQNNGLEVSYQLNNIKPKYEKTESIYLTFEELEQIEKTSDLPEYLENAKDWLIISCYLGQRVSDFLNFTSDMIRYEDGNPLLEFTQKKTGKLMTIPVHHKAIEILNKRNGQFPRQISDVNYNLYIKEVCERAGLTQKVKGSKKVETAPNSKQYRKETGMYPKWELVTSHIGRRSFATNFYGKIPTTYLIYITGHSTETMFLAYIGKSNKDLAKEVFSYFKQ